MRAFDVSEEELKSPDNPMSLYLAQFEQRTGVIRLPGGIRQEVAFSGEILLAGSGAGQELTIEQIRRVSLWTDFLDETGGILSLAGPANRIKLEPGRGGQIDPFALHVYYPLLPEAPECDESDASYVQLEELYIPLSYAIRDGGERSQLIQINLGLPDLYGNNLVKSVLGNVENISFDHVLQFDLLEAGDYKSPAQNSLVTCAGSAPAGALHERRKLKLRFINLSPLVIPDLEDLVKDLIAKACQVWWSKGGVLIEPEPAIVSAAAPPGFVCPSGAGCCVSLPQETILFEDEVAVVNNAAEVYLVDGLAVSRGGGVTHRCGTSDAYVILEIDKARNNRYLLAHELGHVLGLRHPGAAASASGSCESYRAGSYCSVMVADSTNSSRNTEQNIGVIVEPANPLPTGPIFASLGQLGDWDMDDAEGYHHIVRDFPYDDGTESSVPLAPFFANWWSHSDVWNSDKAPLLLAGSESRYVDPGTPTGLPIFASDHTPKHSEPSVAGPNHFYVRLHTCQPLTGLAAALAKVTVHFLLAVPGSAGSLILAPPAGGMSNPVEFADANLPEPSKPQVQHMQWTVPAGLPPDCCVFAVADSQFEDLAGGVVSAAVQALRNIIAAPTSFSFYDLFSRLPSSNNVAQRNLHIHGIAPSPGAPFMARLPWLLFANPLDQPEAARLEIDASLSLDAELVSIGVEANDQHWEGATGGANTILDLHDALLPDAAMTLRLQVGVAPDLALGTTLPIDLRFVIGRQLVSGYRHLIQVVPPAEAAAQALDLLYCALRDVSMAAGSDRAETLAGQVAALWTWLRRGVAAYDRSQMIDVLQPLHTEIALLADELPLASRKGWQLSTVAGQLRAVGAHLSHAEQAGDFPEFLEEMRYLADLVQESASRIVRREQGWERSV